MTIIYQLTVHGEQIGATPVRAEADRMMAAQRRDNDAWRSCAMYPLIPHAPRGKFVANDPPDIIDNGVELVRAAREGEKGYGFDKAQEHSWGCVKAYTFEKYKDAMINHLVAWRLLVAARNAMATQVRKTVAKAQA